MKNSRIVTVLDKLLKDRTYYAKDDIAQGKTQDTEENAINIVVNIEMYEDEFTKREFNKNFTYATLLLNQNQCNDDNSNKLNKVISINFINHNYDNQNPKLLNKYTFSNIVTKEIPSNAIVEMYLVRLNLGEKIAFNKDEPLFITWLRIMASNNIEEIGKYTNGNKSMENSMRVVTEFNNETRWNALHNLIADATYYARKDGIDQGKEDTAIEVAKNMLLENEPIKKIVKYTNLSATKIKSIARMQSV